MDNELGGVNPSSSSSPHLCIAVKFLGYHIGKMLQSVGSSCFERTIVVLVEGRRRVALFVAGMGQDTHVTSAYHETSAP